MSRPWLTEATIRMLGQNVTFTYSQWVQLLDELQPGSDTARRVRDLLDVLEREAATS